MDRAQAPVPAERLPALVVGDTRLLVRSVARLLHRAGCVCDVVTGSYAFGPTRTVRHVLRADSPAAALAAAVDWQRAHGGLVVPCDDRFLHTVRASGLEPAEQCRLVPVTGPEHLAAVASKVGLSRALERAGVSTPRFAVAAGAGDLSAACRALGWPLLVKEDLSWAGEGVHRCGSPDDVRRLAERAPPGPLLVQEWIDGEAIDLSGFFRDGRPVHFVHAELLVTSGGPFGVSSVRRYRGLEAFGRELFDAVAGMAAALGLHGFANVTAIRRAGDGRLLFIEADQRPNLWVDMARHRGDDPALAIQAALRGGRTMSWPPAAGGAAELDLGHILRVPAWEVLLGRRGTWRQLFDHEPLDLAWRLSGRLGRVATRLAKGLSRGVSRRRPRGRGPR